MAYYRHKGEFALKNLDSVTKLCRSTGKEKSKKKPANYPEDYFARFALPEDVSGLISIQFALDFIWI